MKPRPMQEVLVNTCQDTAGSGADAARDAARRAVALHTSAARALGAAPRHLGTLLAQYASVHAAKRAELEEQRTFLQASPALRLLSAAGGVGLGQGMRGR